jgi:type IV pilus assembly protein PilM
VFTASKTKSIVGLDVEAGSIAATEVAVNGATKVTRHGIVPLQPGIFREGEATDAEALGDALKDLFGKHKLSRNVRLGVANQRVAVRTLRLPAIEKDAELETAIRFQAQDHIPMPLEQAVLDWEVVGHSVVDGGQRFMDVVVVAARRDMLASLMEALRKAGLRPVGIDLSAFGIIRALAPTNGAALAPTMTYEERVAAEQAGLPLGTDAAGPARLYCNLGDVTNLAVAQGRNCLFTRISPFGIEGVAQKLAERRQLTLEHARQWLLHVGLDQPMEAVDGEREIVATARECLEEGAAKLADELRLSLEYYAAQETAVSVEEIVACGPGSTIPGLVERLQQTLGFQFQIGKPATLANLDEASAARLTVSYGLALEE